MEATDLEQKIKSTLSLTDWNTVGQVQSRLTKYSLPEIMSAISSLLVEGEIEANRTNRKNPSYRRSPYEH